MSRWFRHYAGLCRDEKLVRAALRSKQPIERVVWIWVAILESASEVNDNGRYDLDPGEASYFLRADEHDVDNIIDALESLGRICAGAVVHWCDRQFKSDTSAERQRRHRDGKKMGDHHNGGVEVTPVSRDSHVTVTPTACDGDAAVTRESRHGDAPETETETETEKKGSEANASAAEKTAVPTSIETIPDLISVKPAYLDAKHELWGEGKRMLGELGVAPSRCGALIGGWCKETGDNYAGVLDAIARAREYKPAGDPIPWIVQALPNTERKPNGKSRTVQDAAHDLARKVAETFGERPTVEMRLIGGDKVG